MIIVVDERRRKFTAQIKSKMGFPSVIVWNLITKQNVGYTSKKDLHLFQCQIIVVYQIFWKYNVVDLRDIGKNLETQKKQRQNISKSRSKYERVVCICRKLG